MILLPLHFISGLISTSLGACEKTSTHELYRNANQEATNFGKIKGLTV